MPIQDLIHQFTEGSGSRMLRLAVVFFGMLGLAVWYDAAAFKNLSTIEGMDAAQLARNISEGKGFTTQFVRPFSVYLIKNHSAESKPTLNDEHPDLANAPLYPLLLAGALKLMPFGYPDVTADKLSSVYLPDLWIAGLNQLLFFVGVWMVFRLGRRLFDEPVAWVSAAVFAGADLFWRFSVSGLSTMLLVVLVLALVEVLARLEPGTREGAARSEVWLAGMAAMAGGLAGLAGVTRYSAAWILVPVVSFLAALPTPRRATLLVSCVGAFLLIMAPWVARNCLVSGTPFGTAGFALFQTTSLFPGFELERTLNADFSLMTGGEFWHKLVVGLRDILEKELPRLGGCWVTAFFLVGLLVPFRSPTLGRLRSFVVVSLIVLTLIQALGRTGLANDSPEVNSENLLVVLAPLIFLFGVGLFFVLLEQFGLKLAAFRLFAMVAFTAVACAPLLFSLTMPQRSALVYPPYHPASIQEKAQQLGENDLVMTDFPWAVAWYGDRQSIWLSLKYREEVSPKFRNDFYAMNGIGKPIRALYLSTRTTKSVETQSLWSWIHRGSNEDWQQSVSDWESFVFVGAYSEREVPTGFPLKKAPLGLWPELFLTDSERIGGKAIKGK